MSDTENEIDFSVLLNPSSDQNYREALKVQNILMYHRSEAILWLRQNNPVVRKAYETGAMHIHDCLSPASELDKAALLVLVKFLLVDRP